MPQASQPLPYTASPYRLALADLFLWARITFVWPPWAGIPSIILPIFPFRSGPLDELYPSPANIYSLVVQLVLTTLQALFLVTLPLSATLGVGFPLLPPVLGAYVPIWLSWVVGFILLNRVSSIFLLDGFEREFISQVPLSQSDLAVHQHERWVFVNGVAAGSHWMQSNLDRLSLTFRREVYGIHNQTRGILFDLFECILERTFSYPTPSTRMVYRRLLDIVSDKRYTKIVLILHSQGAIEGGLALDWLFATVPAPQLARVEVYTFGSAANHFNNPVATTMDSLGRRIDLPADNGDNTSSTTCSDEGNHGGGDSFQQGRVLRHIEHYANSGDYVSKFGILHFRPLPASMRRLLQMQDVSLLFWWPEWRGENNTRQRRLRRSNTTTTMTQEDAAAAAAAEDDGNSTQITIVNRYVGRLFIRPGTGHQFNGNYLDNLFPLDKTLSFVIDDDKSDDYMNGIVDIDLLKQSDIVVEEAEDRSKSGGSAGSTSMTGLKVRVKDVSRLWMYRNGMSPDDDDDDDGHDGRVVQ